MNDHVLIVDDEVPMCELLHEGLERRGFHTMWRSSAAEALEVLAAQDVGVVITDLHMRDMGGIELCARVASSWPDVLVVALTAFGSLESAVAAIRAGAYDYITKPVDIEEVALTLGRALRHRELRDEVKRLRQEVGEEERFGEILGKSGAMRDVCRLVARVADADATVLVTGESGTGKELVARALHRGGRRAAGPFVAVNCAAVPQTLLDSELFGHARGAFTDARSARVGLFVQADGGTLFLDEIGDMPLDLQPKLLRALQERTVRPVGADEEVPFDARIVVATNRDIEAFVAEGRFRHDLYYRINVIRVAVPPLRARGSDVLLLAQRLLTRAAARIGKPVAGLSGAAAEKLLAFPWPGNVRELENCMEHAVAMARYEQVTAEDLPEQIRAGRGAHAVAAAHDASDLVPMDEVERRYIARVLESVGGNKTMAAHVLGFDRKTLYRKLVRYSLQGR